LIGSELWPPPSDAALLTGSVQSSLCSLAQYCSFKLSKCSDHLHHHAPWSSGGINRFRQTSESGFSFLNPFHNHQHIPERARKSVKTPDDQYIALPTCKTRNVGRQLNEFSPVYKMSNIGIYTSGETTNFKNPNGANVAKFTKAATHF
jgi:hypothetical protein